MSQRLILFKRNCKNGYMCVINTVTMILTCHRFEVIGYGCATCVGNTSPLPKPVVDTIKQVRASSMNPSHFRIKIACREVQISSASCVLGGPGGLWHSIWQQALRRPPVRLCACQLPGLASTGGSVRSCRDYGHRLWGGASWWGKSRPESASVGFRVNV